MVLSTRVDSNIVGLAHYRRMPSPLRGQDIGFLDDLFVDPKYRGQKIGEKLIYKMKEISKSQRLEFSEMDNTC